MGGVARAAVVETEESRHKVFVQKNSVAHSHLNDCASRRGGSDTSN